MKYTVWVEDEYNFMKGTDRQDVGEFPTRDEAIAAARRVVDSWLRSRHVPGMSAEELFDGFRRYGEDPFIVGPPDEAEVEFSSWDYARERCEELCSESAARTPD